MSTQETPRTQIVGFDILRKLIYSLSSPSLTRTGIRLRRLGTVKYQNHIFQKAEESEREIYHGSDRIPSPEAFHSTIWFYCPLLREEDGSGGDG